MSFFSSLKRAVSKVATAPVRVARNSPTAVVVRKLRSAAARAPTTPIAKAKAQGWRAPAVWRGAAASRGGVGGRPRYSEPELYEDDELPAPPPEDDGDGETEEDDQGMAGADVYRRHLGGLAGWTDDLSKIGIDLAKGAASGALTTVARGLSPTVSPKAPPPAPPGMSTTAKLAIGVAIGVPVIFLLTRRRGAAAPVAA